MPDAHEITPDEAKAYAVLRGRDGKRITVANQRELDEAVKDGATPDGATWAPRHNRQTSRRAGRRTSAGRGRRSRAAAHDAVPHPFRRPLDGNGRPLSA